jgi:hypothetical protein
MKRINIIFTLIFALLSVNSMAETPFSPNGKYFAEITPENLNMWDIETGEKLYTLDISASFEVNDGSRNITLSDKYNIKTVSFDGRYVILQGRGDFKFYDKWKPGRATVRIDMKESRIMSVYFEEKRWANRELFFALPNTNQYVKCDVSINKDKYYTNIYLNEFGKKSISKLRIPGDPESKGYNSSSGDGEIVEKNGKLYYAVIYTRGTKLYDLANLEGKQKPIKVKFTKEDNFRAYSQDLSVYFNWDEKAFFQTGKPLATASAFQHNEEFTMSAIHGETLISQFNGEEGELKVFDYSKNEYILTKKILNEKTRGSRTSPNGKYLVATVASGKKVFNLKTGELVSELKGDAEFLLSANKLMDNNRYAEAIEVLEQTSENGRNQKEFLRTAYAAYSGYKDHKNASEYLVKLEYDVPKADYYTAAINLSATDKVKANEFLKNFQKYDVRVSAEQLKSDFPLMAGDGPFEQLVQKTTELDNFSGEYTKENLQRLMDNEVGLYELNIKEAYLRLNEYKSVGIDQAIKNATFTLEFVREYYATSPNGFGATYAILGNAYMKTDKLVEAYEQYNLALSVDTTVDFYYVELAIVCQEIKGILAEELVKTKQVFWPEEYRKDYKAMDKQTRELTEAYIEQFPNDPMGYYVRAMAETSLRGDHHKVRMKYAQKAVELFEENNLEVPEYCEQMADRYFGVRAENTAPVAPAGCSERCTKCGGQGANDSSSRCGSCNGTGKRGSCSSCNGRGRKYDTTRNQQVCYRCSGSGRLPCYACSSTGRKSTRKSCSSCSGTGYDCD